MAKSKSMKRMFQQLHSPLVTSMTIFLDSYQGGYYSSFEELWEHLDTKFENVSNAQKQLAITRTNFFNDQVRRYNYG